MLVAGVRPWGAALSLIEPGMRVQHPGQLDWGIGQVQSVIGTRVTINFENRGKILVNTAIIDLEILDED